MAKETAAEKAAAAEAADGEKAVFRLDRGEVLPPQKPFATATDRTDATDKTAKSARKRAAANADAAAEVNATDAAHDLADDNEIDIATVKGTGAEGRITVGDVQAAIDKRDK